MEKAASKKTGLFNTRRILTMDEGTVALIKEIQKNPCLYDKNHADYKNKTVKDRTWHSIARKFHENNASVVKAKWKNLRDCYQKHLNYVNGATTHAAVKYKNWLGSEHMKFLAPLLIDAARPPPRTLMVLPIEHDTSPEDQHNAYKEEDIKNEAESDETDAEHHENVFYVETEPEIPEILEYQNHTRKRKATQFDDVDHLFLSYSQTFKKLSKKKRIMMKVQLAKLFAQAEMSDLNESTGVEGPEFII